MGGLPRGVKGGGKHPPGVRRLESRRLESLRQNGKEDKKEGSTRSTGGSADFCSLPVCCDVVFACRGVSKSL